MNHALIAREAASILGALDPRPEPAIVFQGPTRLIRLATDEHEVWLDPRTGMEVCSERGH
jgi:hypothetical protein